MGAAYVGWMATWWLGLPFGIVLGFVGLFNSNWRNMFRNYWKTLLIIFIAAVITGFCGLIYGRSFLLEKPLNWYFPDDLADRKHFILVGSIHNFSYIGGIIGLLSGLIFQIKAIRRSKTITK